MSSTQNQNEDAEQMIQEALETAIERNDSQKVIDILSVLDEYINAESPDDFQTPTNNIPNQILPSNHPNKN